MHGDNMATLNLNINEALCLLDAIQNELNTQLAEIEDELPEFRYTRADCCPACYGAYKKLKTLCKRAKAKKKVI